MNFIWSGMIIISLIFAGINGRLDQTISAAFSGAEGAVSAVAAMAGVFCFWSGLLNVAQTGGFSEVIAKIINPVLKIVFPRLKRDGRALSAITMNVAANLMGMGNAATPAGIEAMCELDKLNGNSPYASDEMCMLVVINTASIQLIPTTIISLRAAAGSQNPAGVIIPIWISSAVSLISAVCVMKFIIWRGKRRWDM